MDKSPGIESSSYEVRRVISVWLRGGAFACFLAAITLMPWAFGGYAAWAQWIAGLLLLSSIAGLAVALAVDPLEQGRIPIAWATIFGIVLVGAAQLMPFTPGTLEWLSPRSLALQETNLRAPDSPEALLEAEMLGDGWTASGVAWSVDPRATRRQLPLWIFGAACFLLGANLPRQRWARFLFSLCIAVGGAAFAFFGLVQKATSTEMIYWVFELERGGIPFGPYVNRNNASGLLLVCLGAGLTLLWLMRRPWQGASSRLREVDYGLYELSSNDRDSRLRERSWLDPGVLWAVVLIVLIATGIIVSLSRGGTVALVVAAIIVVVAEKSLSNQRFSGLWLAGFALLAVGLLVWLGQAENVRDRLSTLLDDDRVRSDGRWIAWEATVACVTGFSFRGSGLGTFESVLPLYLSENLPFYFKHAENVPLELLVDAGLIGLMLLLIGWIAVAWQAWRLTSHGDDPWARSYGLGGLFALIAVSIASLGDFGLYLPANMMLCCAFCGALFAFSTADYASLPADKVTSPRPWRGRLLLALSACVASLVSLGWAESELWRSWTVERAMSSTRTLADEERPSLEKIEEAIRQTSAAAQIVPDDAWLQYRVAQLQLLKYRVLATEELVASGAIPEQLAWQRSEPYVLHASLHNLERLDPSGQSVAALRNAPTVRESMLPAFRRLLRSREANCTLPEVHIQLAMLNPAVSNVSIEAACLERARNLDPGSTGTMFETGLLEHQAGNTEGAYASWKRGLALSPEKLPEVVLLLGDSLGDPHVIAQALPDDPHVLLTLIQGQKAFGLDDATLAALAARAEEVLEDADLPEEQHAYLSSQVYIAQGNKPLAIRRLSLAVRLHPMEPNWQYQLAQLLLEKGDLEQAQEHARQAARLRPRGARERRLLQEINDQLLRSSPSAPASD